jgi:ADP-ribosyl-[dinitrogen reductase] hydrolase
MHADRAPGNTCLSALRAGGRGMIGKPINDSKGCGGVMRVAPIGLVRQLSPEEAFRLAAEAAALTHGHVSGYLSAGMMAAILRHLMDVADILGAIESSLSILATYPGHDETTAAVRNALAAVRAKPGDHSAAIQALGGGWVGEEALAIAIYSALSADTFVDAVRTAPRTYDWSSNGVMTGSLPVSTEFTLPAGILQAPAQNYSLEVVANGNPSAPVCFSTLPSGPRCR